MNPTSVAPRWSRSRRLFSAGLGLTAAVACVSLLSQVQGLAGERGLVPVVSWMAGHLEQGTADMGAAPSLLWLWPSGVALDGLCWAGIVLATLLTMDVAPAPCCAGLWAVYLSLVHGCGPFLQFQWDTLLIETLAIGAVALPWRFGRGGDVPLPRVGRWLVGWLLFRLMYESGVVKLAAGDAAWPDLSALSYHYETQPLPHGMSWFVHHLPLAAHRVSTWITLALELYAPWVLLGGSLLQAGCGWRLRAAGRGTSGAGVLGALGGLGRHARHGAALALVALMAMVGASGNYGFFNLLSVVLCLALLDDRALSAPGRAWARLRGRTGAAAGRPAVRSEPLDKPVAADADAVAGGCGRAIALPGTGWRDLSRRGVRAAQAWVLVGWGGVSLAVGALQVSESFDRPDRPTAAQREAGLAATWRADGPRATVSLLRAELAPFLSVNAYGLFRVMTRTRPEILLDVSEDGGRHWEPVVLPWKPGAPGRRPGWAQPHMPRLDWQLWFEALRWEGWWNSLRRAGRYPPSGWFASLLTGLAEARPEVAGLLERAPLEGRPPELVRARLALYRYTTPDERAAGGAWWHVEILDERGLVLRSER